MACHSSATAARTGLSSALGIERSVLESGPCQEALLLPQRLGNSEPLGLLSQASKSSLRRATFSPSIQHCKHYSQRLITEATRKKIAELFMNKDVVEKEVCPCGGGEEKDTYENCCARFHKRGHVEPNPLLLLRARYTAYARREVSYIVATTHPDNPDLAGGAGQLADDVRATCSRFTYKGLNVLKVEEGGSPDEAFILFEVKYNAAKGRGKVTTAKEKSRFLKDGERWLYREVVKEEKGFS